MRREQNVAYRVYYGGNDLLGIATLEMPQIQYITEMLNGSGIAGEIDSPVIGLTQSMTCKMTFTGITPEALNALDWTIQPLFECYISQQVADETTGIRDSVPDRINMIGRPKAAPLGTFEQGKKNSNELELELTRLEVLLDGTEKLLIDKLQFIHRVNGNDLLNKVRAQMGLNT